MDGAWKELKEAGKKTKQNKRQKKTTTMNEGFSFRKKSWNRETLRLPFKPLPFANFVNSSSLFH